MKADDRVRCEATIEKMLATRDTTSAEEEALGYALRCMRLVYKLHTVRFLLDRL